MVKIAEHFRQLQILVRVCRPNDFTQITTSLIFKGGGSLLKIANIWFRDAAQKVLYSSKWANFLATPIFPPKMAQKTELKNKHHNIDFSPPIDR